MLLGNADGRIWDAASESKIGLPKFLGAANVGARAHLAPRNIESGSRPGEGGLDIGRHACVGMCVDVCIGMCAGMCRCMCMDICIGMCNETSTHAGMPVCGYLYRHVHRHV